MSKFSESVPKSVKSPIKIPTMAFEIKHGYLLGKCIIGVDEVGRGCLAGPVMTGAVVLPDGIFEEGTSGKDGSTGKLKKEIVKLNPWIKEVRDSKLLPPEKRRNLAPLIREWVKAYSVTQASVEEIDSVNIHYAVHLSMVRGVREIQQKLSKTDLDIHVLVDGKFVPRDLKLCGTAIIKGDLQSLSIACASILAKVERDQLMADMDLEFPGYSFGVHKGYSTAIHLNALERLGPMSVHRKTFEPVKTMLAPSLDSAMPKFDFVTEFDLSEA